LKRIALGLHYEGTPWQGWQTQPHRQTVQDTLEAALEKFCQTPLPTTCAGRTDAGVHATGQVAAFTSDTRVPVEKLPLAINARLPADVRVRAAQLADVRFDPISDCVSKCYRYTIRHSDRGLWSTWHRLDPDAMRAAAGALVGTHDFAAFAQVNHGRETTVRTVYGCTVTAPAPDRVVIEVAGNGFLYNMVRIIAGTLVEAGRGRMEPAAMADVIAARDRTAAGPTLPPQGLCLRWIWYGAGTGGRAGAETPPCD